MPRLIFPANGESAEDPIRAFGNTVRAGIIRHLREHPDQTRAEIADGLDIVKTTVANHLEDLTEDGLVIADPPRDQARRGQWVRYRVNDTAVSDLYLQLGQAIGEL